LLLDAAARSACERLPSKYVNPERMKTQQKAVIVWMEGERTRGLNELNVALSRGWRVVQAQPMGAAGSLRRDVRFASLVIIEREDESVVEASVLEEELEETMLEGDGATQEIPDLPEPPT
jgi:hypothetical protein